MTRDQKILEIKEVIREHYDNLMKPAHSDWKRSVIFSHFNLFLAFSGIVCIMLAPLLKAWSLVLVGGGMFACSIWAFPRLRGYAASKLDVIDLHRESLAKKIVEALGLDEQDST